MNICDGPRGLINVWGVNGEKKKDEMVRWHPRHDGHEFQQVLGVGDGQGGMACSIYGVTKSWTRLSN